MRRLSNVRLVSNESATDQALANAARESMGLAILPLLAMAERRITSAELDQLDALAAALPEDPSWRQLVEFRFRYWTLIARASRNPMLQQRVNLWMEVIGELEAGLGAAEARRNAPVETPSSNYRLLSRALRARQGAVEYWLNVLEPLFGSTEARLGLVARVAPLHE